MKRAERGVMDEVGEVRVGGGAMAGMHLNVIFPL